MYSGIPCSGSSQPTCPSPSRTPLGTACPLSPLPPQRPRTRKSDGIHYEFDRNHSLVKHRQDLARQERESLKKAVAAGEVVETPVPPSPAERQGCV